MWSCSIWFQVLTILGSLQVIFLLQEECVFSYTCIYNKVCFIHAFVLYTFLQENNHFIITIHIHNLLCMQFKWSCGVFIYIYIYIIIYIYIHIYIYSDMVKHQSKPQVYKSDITPCGQIWNLPSTQTTKKQRLPSPNWRQKGRRNNRHQQRFSLLRNILIITYLVVLYQINFFEVHVNLKKLNYAS